MRNKLLIYIILLNITFYSFGQKKIQFEQIAFEYYKDTILKDLNLNKKITISKAIVEDFIYWDVECLKEFNIKIDDTAFAAISVSGAEDLNIGKDNRFKEKKFKKKNTPMIFVTAFSSFDIDKNIVGIIENLEGTIYTYLFEINSDGRIKKWCKDKLMID